MQQKYVMGILAGTAGGVAITVILIIQEIVNMLFAWLPYEEIPDILKVVPVLFSLLSYGLFGIILLLTGGLSIWMARELLQDYSEALLVSGISGVVASLIWIVINIILTLILTLTLYNSISGQGMTAGQTILIAMGAIIGVDLCCCGPVFLAFGTVLALIGGGICGLIVVKR